MNVWVLNPPFLHAEHRERSGRGGGVEQDLIYKLGQLARHPSDWRRTAKAARVFIRHLVRGSRVQERGTASDRT